MRKTFSRKHDWYKLEKLLKSPPDCHREIVRCQFLGIKPMLIKEDLACGKVITERDSITRPTPSP